MPLGSPIYDYEDKVAFSITGDDGVEHIVEGVVSIIDSYGIFGDNSQVYYDIMVEENPLHGYPCLYKHIPESHVSYAE